jgi:hypothetical protein
MTATQAWQKLEEGWTGIRKDKQEQKFKAKNQL